MAGIYGRQIYGSFRWRCLRQFIIKRDERKCRKCGRLAGRPEVHHVIPIRDDARKAWDPDNLEVLCRGCHIEETRKQNLIQRRHQKGARLKLWELMKISA